VSKKNKKNKTAKRVHAKPMTPSEIDLVGMVLARLIRTKAARKRFDVDQIIKMQSVVGDLITFAVHERKRKRSGKLVKLAKLAKGTAKNGPVRIKRAGRKVWECFEDGCDNDTGKYNRLYCPTHRGFGEVDTP